MITTIHYYFFYVQASRSIFSKYNILPNKNELSRKLDLGENIKKVNDNNLITSAVNSLNVGKENMRKIDITLTESSDRSESTSSEIRTENLNSDYEKNGNINVLFLFFLTK